MVMPSDQKFSMRPLYMQVRDLVLERITSGTWKPGAMLPAEVDLARELGISSGTVRKALDALEAEHVVSRRQGKGTFVNDSTTQTLAWRYDKLRGKDGQAIAGHREHERDRARGPPARPSASGWGWPRGSGSCASAACT